MGIAESATIRDVLMRWAFELEYALTKKLCSLEMHISTVALTG